jgi:Flp pilus assembly protein TadG
MATVELACALPVLMLLLAIGLGAIDVARARISCVDAAREGARAAARSDDASGRDWAMRAAPAGAQIDVRRSGDTVTVTVTADRRVLGLSAADVTVRGSATALIEPDDASRPP